MTFAVGTRVRLRLCPYGEPGTVTGERYGKVVVEWGDLRFTGKHFAADLDVVFARSYE